MSKAVTHESSVDPMDLDSQVVSGSAAVEIEKGTTNGAQEMGDEASRLKELTTVVRDQDELERDVADHVSRGSGTTFVLV